MTWILLLLAVWLAWATALFLGQRSLVFVGRSMPAASVPAPGEGVETWTLSTAAGEVEAWYHPPARGREAEPGAAVVFAHGNGERIDDWAGAFRPLAERGVAVVLVEYPGYGRSEGSPSEASVTETMVTAFDRLAARPEVDRTRIVGLGRSLGGGAVAALARHRPLRALVLQSTFTSVRAFAGRYLLPAFLVRDPFDTLEVVRTFEGPVLVVHGRSDSVIPYRHGRALAAASPRATLQSWPCGHNDCPPDWDAWLDDLVGFLREHGIIREPEAA